MQSDVDTGIYQSAKLVYEAEGIRPVVDWTGETAWMEVFELESSIAFPS